MKTLAVLSRKGGSGKTTVSLSLALAAQQAGLRAVLADVDPLQSAAEVVRNRADSPSFLFATRAAKLFVLQDACRRNDCDLLIVDTPTAPEPDVVMAINSADFCLVVGRPTALDIAAIRETISLVQRASCPGLIVLNQCPPNRLGEEPALVRQSLERLLFSRLPVAKTKLRSRAAYQHAFAHSCGVTEWEPDSDAAADVLRLLGEVSEQLTLKRAAEPAPTRQRRDAAPPPVAVLQRSLSALRF
jgi:chromosome partitioning protein